MDVNGEHLHCRTSSSESKAGPELSESESWGPPKMNRSSTKLTFLAGISGILILSESA